MSLLAPALLAGLGLLIVPVLIHLTQRRRSEVTPFPSLMFLREIPFRTTQRRRLRHPLLFALRCLALVLIVLAFTRPFAASDASSASETARDVVLLLDTSGSLGFAGRRDAALAEARGVLGELVEGDRAALVTFDDRAVEQIALTADLDAVRTALGQVEPSDRPTLLETGLQVAGRILGNSERSQREVVLISDFQRTSWEDDGRGRLPDGVILRTVSVADGESANVAVANVQLSGTEDDRHRFLARVVNLGDEPVSGLSVSLELGGRDVATRTVDLEARGAGTAVFDDVPIPDGEPRGRVKISADGLQTDDELRFVATPIPELDVALLEGSRGRRDRSLFLERALTLGDQPRMRITRRPAGSFDLAGLSGLAAVILNDTDIGTASRSQRLQQWVESGGALLVVLGPGSDPAQWAGKDSVLLGGRVGAIADQTSRGGVRLAWLDYDHSVFEPFVTPRSGDFSAARFFRFRRFEPGEGTRVLARFEDGEPALVEHVVGDGRVLTWMSTLDRFWNDLALQPVFLPFVHRTLRHAASYEEPQRWIETGTDLELAGLIESEAMTGDDATEWVLVTPRDDRLPIDTSGETPWIEFPEAGFYQLETVEGRQAPITVAVNLPLTESDLAAVEPERVEAAITGAPAGEAASGTGIEAAGIGTGEPGRREFWWPLLMLAAIVLMTESLVANRWSRRRGPVRVTTDTGRTG